MEQEANQETQEKASEDYPPSSGVIRCVEGVRGKRVQSIYVSAAGNDNVVEIVFVDGTALTVQLFPMLEMQTSLTDCTVENGKLLKEWPRLTVR